jgi:phosphinothricin acetyltransferase
MEHERLLAEWKIREAVATDLPSLRDLYNHYVEHTYITFDLEKRTLEDRRAWFEAFSTRGPHRLFVAETEGVVTGYASSREFRARAAYSRSVETSIYLAPEATGQGLGGALYVRLLEALESEPKIHRAYGGVAVPNDASVALHERLGFREVGRFTEVGFKFGKYWDVVWFERVL